MMSEVLRKDALTAIRALREWVQAVPSDTPLPPMPGIDGDWLDEVEAALAEQEQSEPIGYVASPITWKSERHHSEQIMKVTQHQHPEYGFVHPIFAAPPRREPLTEHREVMQQALKALERETRNQRYPCEGTGEAIKALEEALK